MTKNRKEIVKRGLPAIKQPSLHKAKLKESVTAKLNPRLKSPVPESQCSKSCFKGQGTHNHAPGKGLQQSGG
jgi:hypothetical protein